MGSTIGQEADESQSRSSRSRETAHTGAAGPKPSFATGLTGRVPVLDPSRVRIAEGLPRRVSAERNSGTHAGGDRGHSRNQHRHGAGAVAKRAPRNRSPGRFRGYGAEVKALAHSLLRIWSA